MRDSLAMKSRMQYMSAILSDENRRRSLPGRDGYQNRQNNDK